MAPATGSSAKPCRWLVIKVLAVFVLAVWVLTFNLNAAPAWAHGPLFSAGPETIWKDGVEITLGYHLERNTGFGEEIQDWEAFIEAEYGITSNWQVDVEVPFKGKDESGLESNGLGDIILGTKYQLFVKNMPGAQRKASAFLKVRLPTGDENKVPQLGSGSMGYMGGVSIGHEGRRWYGFADARYLINTGGSGGFEKGDRLFLDAVGGIRPILSEYNEPDTVLMVELNWEQTERSRLGGSALSNSGGWELFISPVVWWTYRQVAIKAGVQIPVAEGLNGLQPSSRYRGHFEVVYHF